ncbi:MAG: molybdenum ABC transporter ATP-binding protein [Burkholderiaceae bacterium]
MKRGIELHFTVQRAGFTLELMQALPGTGVTALFGPSGCGKTTTLRTIAGLERVPGARVRVNGETWQDGESFTPVHRRPIGYVFQEAHLFPHLSVRANLEYGQKRIAAHERRVSLDQAVELLGIGHLMDRRPRTLSGGERQRAAIARALATSPRLLLLDEPLAALDAARKAEVLPWLEKLHTSLDLPVLYVSHSPDEVARLADHLVLMEAGQVVAAGPARELFTRLDLPLAHGDAAAAVAEGVVESHDAAQHLTTVRCGTAALRFAGAQRAPGQRVRLRIQARDVSLALRQQEGTSILNSVPAVVEAVSPDSPGQVMVALDAGGLRLLARITAHSATVLGIAPGLRLHAQVKGAALLD